AVRDEDVDQARLPGHHADVPRELDEDRRLIVRIGETLATLFQRHADDVLRLDLDALDLATLGDIRILAVAAIMDDDSIRNVIVGRDAFETVHRLEAVCRDHRVDRKPHLLVRPDHGSGCFIDEVSNSYLMTVEITSPDPENAPSVLFQS